MQEVVPKGLENIESSSKNWFHEARSHLIIGNKWATIVQCFGIAQDPSNGNYMLVMLEMDVELRKYLQQYHKQKKEYKLLLLMHYIEFIRKRPFIEIYIPEIYCIKLNQRFYISDLGFCGPVDKPLKNIYGNLPYIIMLYSTRNYYGARTYFCI
ncbi:hypothetical protein RclHR1_08480009 [Rhizophagus clarus]|uniref:Protein kinase domain-containing protein n=1 Tax=Rhizophagus clarus TaxID=94130 RepID=A0A2Z6S129_9GLOM|nr:hypothetical protein RclHR1_08480009 [Rhizophagus clarus]